MRDYVNNFALAQFDLSNFKETIFHRFDEAAPIKQKYLPANEDPFMAKELLREIMKRSRLRIYFLRNKSPKDRSKYNRQRNFYKETSKNN